MSKFFPFIFFLLLNGVPVYAQYYYTDTANNHPVIPLGINNGLAVYSFYSGTAYHLLDVNSTALNVSGGIKASDASIDFTFTKYATQGGIVGWAPYSSKIWGTAWSGGTSVTLYGNDLYDNKFSDAIAGAFTGYGYNPATPQYIRASIYANSLLLGDAFGYYTANPCTDTISTKSVAICPVTGSILVSGVGPPVTVNLAYVIAGSEGFQGFLIAVDVNLHPVWTTILTGIPVKICSILKDPGTSDIVVCGQELVSGHLNIFLAGFSSSTGDTLWTRSYKSTSGDMPDITPAQMIQLPNDSLYIAGSGTGNNGSFSFALVTDNIGNYGWGCGFGPGISRSISYSVDTAIVLTYANIQSNNSNILLSKAIHAGDDGCFQYGLSFTPGPTAFGLTLPLIFGGSATSSFYTIGATTTTGSLDTLHLPFQEFIYRCYGGSGMTIEGQSGPGVPLSGPGGVGSNCFCHGSTKSEPIQK